MAKVYVIGTCDTKGDELRFACACVKRAGAKPILVDVSTAAPDADADVTAEAVAGHHPKGKGAVLGRSDPGTRRRWLAPRPAHRGHSGRVRRARCVAVG